MRSIGLSFIIVFLLTSCQGNSDFKLNNTDEINGIFDYLKNDLSLNEQSFDNDDFSLIYLILAECNCVYENIDFVKKYVERNNENLILVVKPDKSEKYVNEIKELSILTNKKFKLIIDEENNFLKYGNFYTTDKYFLVKKFKNLFKLELEKENYSLIEQIN